MKLLQRRLADGHITRDTHRLPLAKPDPSRSDKPLRWACVMDPLAELGMRLHLSGSVGLIEGWATSIGDEVVCAGRVELGEQPTGWRQKEPAYLGERRRMILADLVLDPAWRSLATGDVKDCYASFRADTLAEQLVRLGLAERDVVPLMTLLEELHQAGVRGLPIGPEWSPMLANAMLFQLDEDLAAGGFQHQRWIDDVTFAFDGFGWKEARRLFEASLGRLGLEPNVRKYQLIVDRARAITKFQDPEIEDLARLHGRPDEQIAAVRAMCRATTAMPQPNPARLNYSLAILGRLGCRDALDAVIANPDLLAVAPRRFGSYLKGMAEAGEVDIDWLVDRATRPTSERDVIGQLHLLVACTELRRAWTTEHAAQFLRRAEDDDAFMAVRCWAAKAYARTKAFSPGDASDHAAATGDSQLQRAWTLTLAGADGKKARKAADSLRRKFPECSPAALFVRDAAAA